MRRLLVAVVAIVLLTGCTGADAPQATTPDSSVSSPAAATPTSAPSTTTGTVSSETTPTAETTQPAGTTLAPSGPPFEWERVAVDADGLYAVAMAGDLIVIVGAVGDLTGEIWTSGDGRTWTPVAEDWLLGATVRDIVAAGDGFVAVGSHLVGDPGGTEAVWTSDDGRTWTGIESDGFGGPWIEEMRAVASGPNGLVAVGQVDNSMTDIGMTWHSPDGREWSRAPSPSASFHSPNGDTTVFSVASHSSGYVAAGRSAQASVIWHSVNGTDWTEAFRSENDRVQEVCAAGGGLVAVGSDVWTSPDGLAWVRATALDGAPLESDLWTCTAYGDSILALGRGVALISADGLAWDHFSTTLDGLVTSVATDGSRLIGVGLDIWLSGFPTSNGS